MIYDINGGEIKNPDLSKGFITKQIRIKKDATPIDDVTKFAWYDDDYEEVDVYIEKTEEESVPTPETDRDELLVDMDYRLTLLELGLQEGK